MLANPSKFPCMSVSLLQTSSTRLPTTPLISPLTLRLLLRRSSSSRTTQPTMAASLKRKAGPPLSASPNDQKKPKKDATLTSFFGAPKPAAAQATATTSKANGVATPVEELGSGKKFDVDKWAASLTAEQRGLLKLEIETLHPSWLAHLKDELTTGWFLELKRFLQREVDSGKKIFPPLEEVYSW